MRQENSLLDRLDNNSAPAQYSTHFDWNALSLSVTRNIQAILNVRLGSVKALDDFGMPDFNDVVNEFPDAVSRIRSAIQMFVQAYEPRLSSVNVFYVPDPEQPLVMRYSIEGQLLHRGESTRVCFDTVLTGAGQATVRV